MALEILIGFLVVSVIASNLLWIRAWVQREQFVTEAHNKERYELLERIQRPEFLPADPDRNSDFVHEVPNSEMGLVGAINPDLGHRDREGDSAD